MTINLNSEIPEIGKKPHTAGWLTGAIIFSILPVAPAVFVYSQWQDINEFTFMVTELAPEVRPLID